MTSDKVIIPRAKRHEARVVCHALGLDVDCVVLNVSLSGALLECITIPEATYREPAVSLRIQDVLVRCSLVRLDHHWIGIHFLEEPAFIARVFHLVTHG